MKFTLSGRKKNKAKDGTTSTQKAGSSSLLKKLKGEATEAMEPTAAPAVCYH